MVFAISSFCSPTQPSFAWYAQSHSKYQEQLICNLELSQGQKQRLPSMRCAYSCHWSEQLARESSSIHFIVAICYDFEFLFTQDFDSSVGIISRKIKSLIEVQTLECPALRCCFGTNNQEGKALSQLKVSNCVIMSAFSSVQSFPSNTSGVSSHQNSVVHIFNR